MILVGVIAGSISAVAPSAPTSFTATAASSTQINLSWAAPATNGGAAVTSYTLKRGATTIYTGAGTSFSDTGLSPATGYSYTVLATNSIGNGPTASASATTPATVPTAPTSFSATAASSSSINLSWAAPSSNGGAAVTSYTLKRGATTIYSGGGTSFTDTGLAGSTNYSYTVLANNSAGAGPTASASATTPSSASVPGAVSATVTGNYTQIINVGDEENPYYEQYRYYTVSTPMPANNGSVITQLAYESSYDNFASVNYYGNYPTSVTFAFGPNDGGINVRFRALNGVGLGPAGNTVTVG